MSPRSWWMELGETLGCVLLLVVPFVALAEVVLGRKWAVGVVAVWLAVVLWAWRWAARGGDQ